VPQLRTYFSSDLIPVLEHQRGNFDSLDGTSSVDWIAPLLLIVGIVVILFAALMIVRNRRRVSRVEAIGSASVVLVVGVAVVLLVLGLSLIPRVSNGQKLLDALRPANSQQRVAGDRVGINMVSTIVNAEDPVMTASGGAAAEVPKLVAFVSKKTGLSQPQVLTVLQTKFPHVAALLQAIPFSAVTAELPAVLKALGPGGAAVIPRLAQTVSAAPLVTNGWDNVPGTAGVTRFSGGPVRTVPEVRTYFSSDVIPVLETQRGNYEYLTSTSKIDFLGPLVLIIGIIVILYGLLMLFVAWRREPESPPAVSQASPERVATNA
jgi:cytochrome bd-type quinol oxidase subunit 1